MNLESTELARVAHRQSLPGIRWNAVFGGMCVGMAAYVLLMLAGVGIGLAAAEGAGADVPGAALLLNLVSALLAAALGAFVTARAADLRRPSDGVIHGLVVWGVATVAAALFALVAMRDVAGGMLLVLAHQQASRTAIAQIDRNEPWRNGTISVRLEPGTDDRSDLPRRTGWENRAAAAMAEAPAKREMGLPGYANLMLCAAIAMGLFGGIAGGLLGTRRPRRADPLDQKNWRDVVDNLDI